MAAIRSKDTLPERLLRQGVWAAGLRGYRKHASLPGRPDLVFAASRVAVFVDGCFWHGCPEHGRMKTANNNDYWSQKLLKRKEKDTRDTLELEKMGFQVLRFWEHDVRQDTEKVVEDIWLAVKSPR